MTLITLEISELLCTECTLVNTTLTGKFENCAPKIRPRFAKFTSKYIRASKLRARYLSRAIQTFQTGIQPFHSRFLVTCYILPQTAEWVIFEISRWSEEPEERCHKEERKRLQRFIVMFFIMVLFQHNI